MYDIKFEEILHIVPMCQTVKEIETLEAKHGDVLSQILKEKKDRIKLEKMNSSPFKSQEKLHQEAFKK